MSGRSTAQVQRRHPIHRPVLERADRPIIVFLTVCTAARKPILPTSPAVAVIIDAWQRADTWRVGRYVIMPDHVHLFCAPGESEVPLSRWVQYWKSLAARRWPQREDHPIWQRHFWDTQLRRGESYANKWEYVRENPVRSGLVASPEQWPYAGELNVLRWDGG